MTFLPIIVKSRLVVPMCVIWRFCLHLLTFKIWPFLFRDYLVVCIYLNGITTIWSYRHLKPPLPSFSFRFSANFMLLGKFYCCIWPNIEKIIMPSGHTACNRCSILEFFNFPIFSPKMGRNQWYWASSQIGEMDKSEMRLDAIENLLISKSLQRVEGSKQGFIRRD